MSGAMRRHVLHVEGKNDMHVIRHLLRRHQIECDERYGPVEIRTPRGIRDTETEGVKALLDAFEFAVQQSSGIRIGFVLDADDRLERRWQQITARVRKLGLTPPPAPPRSGMVIPVPTVDTTLGVWLMPNNRDPGKLEDFLRGLIGSRNRLIRHAESATNRAVNHGAKYRRVDRIKAVLHTWLAWQRVPGVPFGTALNNKYFGHASPTAKAFIAWFKTLYGIP